jgi:hypothetical protein
MSKPILTSKQENFSQKNIGYSEGVPDFEVVTRGHKNSTVG